MCAKPLIARAENKAAVQSCPFANQLNRLPPIPGCVRAPRPIHLVQVTAISRQTLPYSRAGWLRRLLRAEKTAPAWSIWHWLAHRRSVWWHSAELQPASTMRMHYELDDELVEFDSNANENSTWKWPIPAITREYDRNYSIREFCHGKH